MRRKMYSILDKKAELFNLPFYAVTDGEAIRNVQRELLKGESLLSQFPEDYSLFRVGEFIEETGEVFPIDKVERVITLEGLRDAQNNSGE